MKKISNASLFLLVLILTSVMTSCGNSNSFEDEKNGVFSISASREKMTSSDGASSDGERLTYESNNLDINVKWDKGDRLYLYDFGSDGQGDGSYVATFENTTGASSSVNKKIIAKFTIKDGHEDKFVVGNKYKAIAVSAASLSAKEKDQVQYGDFQYTTTKYPVLQSQLDPAYHLKDAFAWVGKGNEVANATLKRLSELSIFFSENSLTFIERTGEEGMGILVDGAAGSNNGKSLYDFKMPFAVIVTKFIPPTSGEINFPGGVQYASIELGYKEEFPPIPTSEEYSMSVKDLAKDGNKHIFYRFVKPVKSLHTLKLSLIRNNGGENYEMEKKAENPAYEKEIYAGRVYHITFDANSGDQSLTFDDELEGALSNGSGSGTMTGQDGDNTWKQ